MPQQASPVDCDDVMLLLATPGHSSEQLDSHLSSCGSCRELASDLKVGNTSPEQAPEADELIGRAIGVYRISQLIGSGGMGRVYLAVHPEIHSRVAIKVFSKDWTERPELVQRFFTEARATNLIAHENIVNVLDVSRLEDGRPYMVMEHLRGAPLSKRIGGDGFSDAMVVRLLLDVLSALDAAHEQGIVHRDLKPDNIFVSPEGRATLLDFGVAKLLPESVGDSAETATGTVLGTPHYMSPEQAKGDRVDARTDVYAMGVILYECLIGQRPFRGTSLYRLLNQHVHHEPSSPRALRPELDVRLCDVVLKALAKVPSDRYETIAEMRAALLECEAAEDAGVFTAEAAIAEREHAAKLADRNVGERPPTKRRAKGRRRSLVIFGATVVAAALVGYGVLRLTVLGDGDDGGTKSQPVTTILVPNDSGANTAADAASLAIDASPVDAGALAIARLDAAPTKTPPRPRGIAPLSLLDAATKLARGEAEDAVLLRVHISGLGDNGRVMFGKGAEVRFDFLSADWAERASGRSSGRCIARVSYRRASTGVFERKSSRECDELRTLQRPRCSMAKLIKARRKSGHLPADASFGPRTTARLTRSKNRGTPFWKLVLDGRSFKLTPC